MKVSRLQIVFFGLAMAALLACARAILGTHLGGLGAALAVVIGLLRQLYRAALLTTLAAWEGSGKLAQCIEVPYRRRMAAKESSHAARLL